MGNLLHLMLIAWCIR